jgi:hypothetical protein
VRGVDADGPVVLGGMQPGERAGAAADRVLEQLPDIFRRAGDLDALASGQEQPC